MPINSVETNNSAMVALQTLNYTNSQLQGAQKQISTGFRVSDAADDGAAYAVAQGIRSTVYSLTSANQQLNGVQGLLSTSLSSLNNISNTLTTMRGLLVKLADNTTSATDRQNYQDQYTELSATWEPSRRIPAITVTVRSTRRTLPAAPATEPTTSRSPTA